MRLDCAIKSGSPRSSGFGVAVQGGTAEGAGKQVQSPDRVRPLTSDSRVRPSSGEKPARGSEVGVRGQAPGAWVEWVSHASRSGQPARKGQRLDG